MVEKTRGRPRSEATRISILEATRDLVSDIGYDQMTIEAIAARAGAGKASIYRWWPSKASIVADAVIAGYLELPSIQVPHTDSLHDDLAAWGAASDQSIGTPGVASIVRALATAASTDQDDASRLYEKITGPFYLALIERLDAAKQVGQLRESVDSSAIADALIGSLLFRTLAGLPSSNSISAMADALLDHPEN